MPVDAKAARTRAKPGRRQNLDTRALLNQLNPKTDLEPLIRADNR